MLLGEEHVRAYRETGGETGHEWRPGVFTLLLTTTGRRSGQPYDSYAERTDRQIPVVVLSPS